MRLSYFPKPPRYVYESLVLPTELLYFIALSVSLTGFKELENALTAPVSLRVLLVDFYPAVDDLLEFLDETVLCRRSSFRFLRLSLINYCELRAAAPLYLPER